LIFKVASSPIEPAVTALLAAAENAQPARWIEFPALILLFATVPGDPDSGAFYVVHQNLFRRESDG